MLMRVLHTHDLWPGGHVGCSCVSSVQHMKVLEYIHGMSCSVEMPLHSYASCSMFALHCHKSVYSCQLSKKFCTTDSYNY